MREACLKKMAEHGLDPSIFEDMPDEGIASVAGALDDARSPMEDDDEEQWPMPDDEQDDDEMMGQFAERAHQYAERARRFAERCSSRSKKFAERYKKFGEMNPEGDPRDERSRMEEEERMRKMKGGKAQPAMMSEQGRRDLQATRNLRKFAEEKASKVEDLIDHLSQAGKLPPSQVTYVRERLLRADNLTKFSEGGRTVTEFDLQVRELKSIPSMFGEKFGAPVRLPSAADNELEKVVKFSETAQMAKGLEAAGKTPAEWVEEFQKVKKANPKLTAVEYGVSPYFEG